MLSNRALMAIGNSFQDDGCKVTGPDHTGGGIYNVMIEFDNGETIVFATHCVCRFATRDDAESGEEPISVIDF